MRPALPRDPFPLLAGALATAVVAVLNDEEARQRRGAAARALASERYAWDGIARQLLEIYEDAAA